MLLNSKQFILTSASRQLIGSLHFMTTSTKVNSFTILKTKNQFILLCWKKQLWRMCTNFWINPHNGKLPSRLAPAQCQNSLAPQLLSNINQSKSSLLIWHYVSYLFLLSIFLLSYLYDRETEIISAAKPWLMTFSLISSVSKEANLYRNLHQINT